jgi:hypothetical protein
MNPLVSLLLRSIAGKAFQKAPEGSALNLMGTKMEKYDPISGIINLASNIPAIGQGIEGIKNTLMPEAYGTSQKEFDRYQGVVDSSLGTGTFQDLVSGIYGQGGIMQGYNPVSAFGRGPVGAIENRISSIMNRTAPMTDFARNQIWSLYDARDELVGGQGINAVTRPGTYGYDDVTIGGSGTGGDGGSSSSSDNFSSQGFGSEGNTSVSTDFGSFDFSRD